MLLSASASSVRMPDSSKELDKHDADSVQYRREDSEYVRLVVSNEPTADGMDVLQPQPAAGSRTFSWWIKAFVGCIFAIIFLLVFLKWGVPFLFEKVLIPIMQWEATAFGRPVLAVVLVSSLAITFCFPTFLFSPAITNWPKAKSLVHECCFEAKNKKIKNYQSMPIP